MATNITTIPKDKSVEFIQVSSHQLGAVVKAEALNWVRALGEAMANSERERLKAVHDKMDRWAKVLNQVKYSLPWHLAFRVLYTLNRKFGIAYTSRKLCPKNLQLKSIAVFLTCLICTRQTSAYLFSWFSDCNFKN